MYRIFIVEDDAAIAGVIRRHLEGWGYTVRCAERFDDVLSEFAAFDPHLVLLDIMMPEMDGITALAKLRQVSNVPVILLTAKSEDTDKILGLNVGADDYITKPFNPVEVAARVRSQLRRYFQLGAVHSGRRC